ncbi:hypothetical protein JRQ81_018715 [Phrynocephalus forsythii]|uniref:Uncharacterized protein n=1 Tax=Phrynocephalus forsythii TaxID=171643 RepID=A0A9Q1AZM0_9SAUR|nr:hypothetical protein JRQ81_018715 [Phrynocephalus forsythii]
MMEKDPPQAMQWGGGAGGRPTTRESRGMAHAGEDMPSPVKPGEGARRVPAADMPPERASSQSAQRYRRKAPAADTPPETAGGPSAQRCKRKAPAADTPPETAGGPSTQRRRRKAPAADTPPEKAGQRGRKERRRPPSRPGADHPKSRRHSHSKHQVEPPQPHMGEGRGAGWAPAAVQETPSDGKGGAGQDAPEEVRGGGPGRSPSLQDRRGRPSAADGMADPILHASHSQPGHPPTAQTR